jgi:hypothetical protein
MIPFSIFLFEMSIVFDSIMQTFGRLGVEVPKYELVRKAATYEIRDYPKLLAAEVDSNADK